MSGITFAVGKPAALRLNRGWTNYGRTWQGASVAREGELCLVSGLITPTGTVSRPADVAVLTGQGLDTVESFEVLYRGSATAALQIRPRGRPTPTRLD